MNFRTAPRLNTRPPLFFALLCFLLTVAHCRPAPPEDRFDLPAPPRLSHPMKLWATWYWTPAYQNIPDGIPLLDSHNKPLGPRLAQDDFCSAAVECAVRVGGKLYIYHSLGKTKQTDCSRQWKNMPHAPYARFQPSKSRYGEGSDNYQIAPYRSLAVDINAIPIGSVLYVPAARGVRLTLPDGTKAVHDGYFFAADEGFGINENHIDVFIGTSDKNPFDFVKSERVGTFTAYRVKDRAIVRRLRNLHRFLAD